MDFAQLGKLQGTDDTPTVSPSSNGKLTGIVKVRTAGYRPKFVAVRSVIGERIFTAEFSATDLATIKNDPGVEEVSLSHPLPLQKLPQP